MPCAPVEGADGEHWDREQRGRGRAVQDSTVAAEAQRHLCGGAPCHAHSLQFVVSRMRGRTRSGAQRGHAADACANGIAVVGVDCFFNAATGVRHHNADAMPDIGVVDEDGSTKARAEGKIVTNIITRC